MDALGIERALVGHLDGRAHGDPLRARASRARPPPGARDARLRPRATGDDLAHWDALARGLREGGVEGFVAAYELDRVPPGWRATVERVLRQRLAGHTSIPTPSPTRCRGPALAAVRGWDELLGDRDADARRRQPRRGRSRRTRWRPRERYADAIAGARLARRGRGTLADRLAGRPALAAASRLLAQWLLRHSRCRDLRRDRGGRGVVPVAVRAAARARLPLDGRRRLAERALDRRRAARARAEPAVHRELLGDLHPARARCDRDRVRVDREQGDARPYRGGIDRRARRAVRAAALCRCWGANGTSAAARPRRARRAGGRRRGLRDRLDAVHRARRSARSCSPPAQRARRRRARCCSPSTRPGWRSRSSPPRSPSTA
jgi:hypothetical protein